MHPKSAPLDASCLKDPGARGGVAATRGKADASPSTRPCRASRAEPNELAWRNPILWRCACALAAEGGDIQTFLDQLVSDVGRGGCAIIVVVNVEVAIDPVRGNLASVETLRVWGDMVADRRIMKLVGGPPCEACPKARGIGDGEHPGPTILMSAEEPGGSTGH